MIAIPWYFTNTLNSNSMFSFLFGVVTFLGLFWGLYSGTIIDRYCRKTILEKLNFYTGSIIFIISSCIILFSFNNSLPILISLVFSATCFYYIIYYPTLYAFSQEISEKKNYVKINSYIEIVGQSTTVAAGGLAAILLSGIDFGFIKIEPLAIEKILIIDSITYLIASYIISKIKFNSYIKRKNQESIFNRVKVGVNFLKERPSNTNLWRMFSYYICFYIN